MIHFIDLEQQKLFCEDLVKSTAPTLHRNLLIINTCEELKHLLNLFLGREEVATNFLNNQGGTSAPLPTTQI
ncbi:MAG: hypothetical protein ACRCY5_02025 [Phocaeicola sp.]